MKRGRKKLYSVKAGFRLVRNAGHSATTENKFNDFLLYLWECCPSGVLAHFQQWLSAELMKEGLDVCPEIIDSAMSKGFRRLEREINRKRAGKT